jgi:hypothetical protein
MMKIKGLSLGIWIAMLACWGWGWRENCETTGKHPMSAAKK